MYGLSIGIKIVQILTVQILYGHRQCQW